MRILGIDTSTSVATVALMDDEKLITEMSLNDKKTHSQKLMVLIDYVLEMNEITMDDLDAIAVGVGPGSFTGLRIGVTTAKGLAHGAKKPVIEVSSLSALAHNIQSNHPVCAMMDARRDTVFTTLLGGEPFEESQMHIDELLEICQQYQQVTFLGDAATKHHDKIVEVLNEKAVFAPKHLNQVSAGSLCDLAFEGARVAYDAVHVSYLRKTQAEREYDEKQK